MDFFDLFTPEAGFAEMALRGTVMYWFLFLLLRLSGRRDIGSLSVADLLVLVMVADAAGDAMSAGSKSLADGMYVAATIVGWSVIVDRLGYYVPSFRRFIEPSRVCLVRDGRIVASGMRREHLTRSELMEQLRLKGVASLGELRRVYLEANGEFSIIRRDAPTAGQSTLGGD
ncbi:DUF421 domain-containing protein [Achromobacter sp. GG226]|uniref:DUF421 domain-containing protein n=1 Tax=Verticiella alkaliphila TaxID=2779529 RepID=UPI001C0DE026|nr:YetF domain-containing protein [Verticiella sp. GG226]MBU4611113.1 DUF421 domain-containing protein [Verticiella sp. GG226]